MIQGIYYSQTYRVGPPVRKDSGKIQSLENVRIAKLTAENAQTYSTVLSVMSDTILSQEDPIQLAINVSRPVCLVQDLSKPSV